MRNLSRCANPTCSEPLTQVAIAKGLRLCPSCWAATAVGVKFGAIVAFSVSAIVGFLAKSYGLW